MGTLSAHVWYAREEQQEAPVNYRKLGGTRREVSEVGYGAWGIGKTMWIGAEDDEPLRALNEL